MKASATSPSTVDEYMAGFPADVRRKLAQLRTTIRRAAPKAEESIAYRMPAYKLNGALVYFAAFKAHIGLYPMTEVVKERFAKELSAYDGSKGTVRFPLDQRLPLGLIANLVKARVSENAERAAGKKTNVRRQTR